MLEILINNIKEIINLTPEKRSNLVLLFFSALVIYYLYNENKRLQSLLDIENQKCNNVLEFNRQESQKHLNSFIQTSNLERDSIYKYYNKEIFRLHKQLQDK